MKRFLKFFFLTALITLLLFQFYPKPEKNSSTETGAAELGKIYNTPDAVQEILKTSCYDCHSNNTKYPWYAHIQPFALWLGDHIKEGKGELNFSQFGNYPIRKQYRKFEEIIELVKDDEMPLKSYTLIHRDAVLSKSNKMQITDWAESQRTYIQSHYPPDSLISKKKK